MWTPGSHKDPEHPRVSTDRDFEMQRMESDLLIHGGTCCRRERVDWIIRLDKNFGLNFER